MINYVHPTRTASVFLEAFQPSLPEETHAVYEADGHWTPISTGTEDYCRGLINQRLMSFRDPGFYGRHLRAWGFAWHPRIGLVPVPTVQKRFRAAAKQYGFQNVAETIAMYA